MSTRPLLARALPLGLTAVLLSLSPTGARAAGGITFTASVSRDRLEVGETLTLEVTVTVADKARIGQLVLPTHKGFERISTNKSTQMSFMYGSGGSSLQQTEVHTLILRAARTGAQTITPGILVYGGKTRNTRPIVVTVLKVGQGPKPPPAASRPGTRPGGRPSAGRRAPDPFDPFGGFDPFDILRGGGQPVGDEDIVLRATVDKRTVTLGEQVSFYVQVLTRFDIADFPSFKLPKLDGFWVEDLASPKRISPTIKYVKGVPYRAYLIRRKALFPVQTGKVKIDPVEVEIATGLGFLRSGRTVKRYSRAIEIEVKPLPTAGQPANFPSMNVGQWTFEATASADRIPLGQTVTLKLKARGRGNLNSLVLPTLENVDGFRVYDPTEKIKASIQGSSFGGTKVSEVVLVPQRSGTLRVPRLELLTFDPVRGQYITRRTDPIEIEVSAGSGLPAAVAAGGGNGAGPSPGPSNVLDPEGLRTIRYASRMTRSRLDPWRGPVFSWAIGLPFLLFAAFLLGDRLRAFILHRAGADAGRRAQGLARAKLKAARRQRKKGAWGAAFAETERALLDYVAEKSRIPARGMPRPELSVRLLELGFEAASIEALLTVLEQAETARFSPTDPSSDQVDTLLEKAAEVLAALDDGPTIEEVSS